MRPVVLLLAMALNTALATERIFSADTSIRLPSGLVLDLEIADTDSLRQRGLSGRTSMPWNRGMLFAFPDTTARGFWMIDCHFPLDLAYIGPGGVVREILAMDPQPGVRSSDLHVYRSRHRDIVWALETHRGFLAAQGISVGDTLPWVTRIAPADARPDRHRR